MACIAPRHDKIVALSNKTDVASWDITHLTCVPPKMFYKVRNETEGPCSPLAVGYYQRGEQYFFCLVFQKDTAQLIVDTPHGHQIYPLSYKVAWAKFSPDCRWLAITNGSQIDIINIERQCFSHRIPQSEETVFDFALIDGFMNLCFSQSKKIHRINILTYQTYPPYDLGRRSLDALHVAPNGEYYFIIYNNGLKMRILSTRNHAPIKKKSIDIIHKNELTYIQFSSNSEYILVGDKGGDLLIIDFMRDKTIVKNLDRAPIQFADVFSITPSSLPPVFYMMVLNEYGQVTVVEDPLATSDPVRSFSCS